MAIKSKFRQWKAAVPNNSNITPTLKTIDNTGKTLILNNIFTNNNKQINLINNLLNKEVQTDLRLYR